MLPAIKYALHRFDIAHVVFEAACLDDPVNDFGFHVFALGNLPVPVLVPFALHDSRTVAMKNGYGQLLAVLSVLMALPAIAHHGQAAYGNETVTLNATVTEFRFVNPHAQVSFDVAVESGETQHWTGALTAPNKLARAGWTKYTLEPGDEIEITGRRGRNGAHAMHIRQIVMAKDGHVLQLREELDGMVLP